MTRIAPDAILVTCISHYLEYRGSHSVIRCLSTAHRTAPYAISVLHFASTVHHRCTTESSLPVHHTRLPQYKLYHIACQLYASLVP
eukprot:2451240-Rhodomonas_salina.1